MTLSFNFGPGLEFKPTQNSVSVHQVAPVAIPPAPPARPPINGEAINLQPAVSFQSVTQDLPTVLDEKKDRISKMLGIDIQHQAPSPEKLAAAIRDGVLCKQTIRRWRGTTILRADELDLSDELTFLVDHAITLGCKYLVPKSEMNKLNVFETRARNAIRDAGFWTAEGIFIPTARWHHFKDIFDEAQAGYMACVEDLASRVEEWRDWCRKEYAPLARKAWNCQRKTWSQSAGDAPGLWAGEEHPPQTYIEAFTERLAAQIPSKAEILAAAEFSYSVSIIHAPQADLANDFVQGDDDLQDELRAHMNNKRKALIDDFLFAARAGLAESLLEVCNSVRDTLSGKQRVHGKTINMILRRLADLQDLNCVNDEEFGKAIQDLKDYVEIKATNEDKDADDIRRAMTETARRVKQALKKDLEKGSKFANLEV